MAQENGMIRLQVFNQASKNRRVLKEQRSEILGYVAPASRTNPREQDELLDYNTGGVIDENEVLELWGVMDAVDTIESEESKLHFDVTLRDKRSGQLQESALNFENMEGFTVAGAVDIPHIAGQEIKIATYVVPTGTEIKLGRRNGQGKYYCYLGDDT